MDTATRRVVYQNGDVECLCGRHAGVARRFKRNRGGARDVRRIVDPSTYDFEHAPLEGTAP